MSHKPQKRHVALQPLSREHHFGLLLSWKIRMGVRNHVAPKRIWTYANWFFKNHLVPHFEMEELYVFTILEVEHELVQQALNDHKNLIALFQGEDNNIESLLLIEKALEQHIRFEERVLFPEIQRVATEAQLLEIEKIHQSKPFIDKLDDEFWR